MSQTTPPSFRRVRLITLAVLIVGLFAAITARADASFGGPAPKMQSCGTVQVLRVASDPRTTTCSLARSAARDLLAKTYGESFPRSVEGYSAKTGRTYRLRTWEAMISRGDGRATAFYIGKAGQAWLVARFSLRI